MSSNTKADAALVEAERAAWQSYQDAEIYEAAMGRRYLDTVRRGVEFRKEGKERRADYLDAADQTYAWSWVWCIAQYRLNGKELETGHAIAARARPVPEL